MQGVHPVCCGIDCHQAVLSVCLRRVSSEGQMTLPHRAFGTTDQALVALSDWLIAEGCPVVAMESTGVDWKPSSHGLDPVVEVVVGNPLERRRRPGKQTDQADATWMAELVAHGLIRPRFLPPPLLRALRELTRNRVGVVQTRGQAKNRVHNILEDTNSKRASVVSDLCGRRGRLRLAALLAGERDAHKRAALAKGRLRRKWPQLEVALQGHCTAHHGWLIQSALERIELLERQSAALEARLGKLVDPLHPPLEQLSTMPGVQEYAARAVMAAIGTDMSRCGSAARVASWAGVSPGHHERAGKRRRGQTTKGHRS